MYYAKRHGYDFSHSTTSEFADYFPKDLFSVSMIDPIDGCLLICDACRVSPLP